MNGWLALSCLAFFAFGAGACFVIALDRRRTADWVSTGVYGICAIVYFVLLGVM